MLRNGGIEAMQKTNDAKAKILYDAIDGSDGFYVNPISKANRSNMNVPFTIPASQELEAVFIKEATAAGMVRLSQLWALVAAQVCICCLRNVTMDLYPLADRSVHDLSECQQYVGGRYQV